MAFEQELKEVGKTLHGNREKQTLRGDREKQTLHGDREKQTQRRRRWG